jgi:glucose/arabinose dehydrogenase
MRLLAISVMVVAACGGDHPNNGDGDGGGSGSDGGSNENCINTAGPPIAAPAVVTGSTVKATKLYTLGGSALLVTAPPNDGRLFVLQQDGRIQVIDDGVVKADPFLDLQNVVLSENPPGERGLLGLAFHPNYACNGQFFVEYTTSDSETIQRFTVSQTDLDKADPMSGETILKIPDFAENHNAGMIEFGSDGYLYITSGDGGQANDPRHNGQAIDRADPTCITNQCEPLLAKMLRIDVDHPANGKMYGIPANNPYAGGGGEPEILIRGFRNPWRWSFDRMTGDIYVGDVGQDLYEEVDVIPVSQINGTPGHPLNFGWSIREATHPFLPNAGGTNCNNNGTCDTTGLVDPLIEKDHANDGWRAVIGGQVYRGQNYPALTGNYFFSDNTKSVLVEGTYNAMGPSMSIVEIAGTNFNSPSSIHADAAGELWLADTLGNLYQIQSAP